MKKLIITLAAAALAFVSAFPQTQMPLLYRGRVFTPDPTRANGTFYRESPRFVEGSLTYAGRRYEGVKLNIDATTQQVLAAFPTGAGAVCLESAKIGDLVIGGVRYERLSLRGLDVPDGFYEQVRADVFRRVDKTLMFDTGVHNGRDIGYDDPGYDTAVHSYYGCKVTYWQVREDGTVKRYRKMPKNVSAVSAVSGKTAREPSVSYFTLQPSASENTVSMLPKDYFNANPNYEADGTVRYVTKEELEEEGEEPHYEIRGAVVSVDVTDNHKDARMGVEKLSAATINKIPAAFGEADVIKAVLSLPGVKSTGDAAAGFNVRGGTVDQNLILFNGCTIFNPTHLFGIMSAFDADNIDNVELYKSTIPIDLGGRLSSVVDVKTRDGSDEKLKGSVGLGLINSRFSLEGPIRKGRASFILGGRIAYSNWMLKMLPENSYYAGGSTSFGDANASLKFKVTNHSTLRLYAYYSADRFSLTADTTFRYSNLNAAAKWESVLGSTRMEISGGYNRYISSMSDTYSSYTAYNLDTGIGQIFGKLNFRSRLSENNVLQYGVEADSYDLNPGVMTPASAESLVSERSLERETGLEGAVFLGDSWNISEKFSLDAGLRYSAFKAGDSTFYGDPEYRASVKYTPVENLSFKAGINSMTQHIHLVTNTASISPMDTWKLCDATIKPQKGGQVGGGVYWTHSGTGIEFSLEGYAKQFHHFLDYKSGAALVMNSDLASSLVDTDGRSWGAELMVRKNRGKLTGWLSYSYSRSLLKETEDRGAETINGGDWYSSPTDIPNDVKMVCNYELTKRFSFSLGVNYSSGRPVTLPVGQYDYAGSTYLYYSGRNAYRMPDYFRMDAAVIIAQGHRLKQLVHANVTVGVYNLTGRRNPYSVYYSFDDKGVPQGHMLSVFACPIPYINLNFKF